MLFVVVLLAKESVAIIVIETSTLRWMMNEIAR